MYIIRLNKLGFDQIMVVLEEVVRVDNMGCPSGTRSWKGWEPLLYTLSQRKWWEQNQWTIAQQALTLTTQLCSRCY